jgi:hypothetical protein
MPWLRRKSRAALALLTSKRSCALACLGGEVHVVEHGASIKELGIETEAAALAGKRAPIIDAARVIEEQRRLGIPDELGYFLRELAIRNAYANDCARFCTAFG